MQLRWHREDHVEVGHREQLLLLRFDPTRLFQALALGTVPVATGVVARLLPSAVVAHLQVAAQKRRATVHDVSDRSTTLPPKLLGRRCMRSENVSQF